LASSGHSFSQSVRLRLIFIRSRAQEIPMQVKEVSRKGIYRKTQIDIPIKLSEMEKKYNFGNRLYLGY